ncbi:MAG: cell division FtsA domain-containing protein [Butyrivibrio sp.]
MSDNVICPEQFVFGLDIGTRSIVGTIGYMDKNGFHVIAMEIKEHDTRAMLDGQVHDIAVVGEEIALVKDRLEKKIGRPLKSVCIAAAGRVLRTINVKVDSSMDEELRITSEDIYNLDLKGVEQAHRKVNEQEQNINFYCVGYTPVKYYLNDYEIKNLEGHKASKIGVELLATFLPEDVVDGLYSAVEAAGLEVANLTLEPIAAMNVAIPEQYRLLNIALVDVGAGTSDICITKDGSVVGYGMIPSAGDEISELLAKHYLVDFKQAEKIKISSCGKRSISFKDIMGTKISVTPEEVIEVVSPVTRHITSDVADKIKELNGGRPVSAVFVVGGGGKIPGFTRFLAGYLELPEARVALRGKEVLSDIEFAVTNVKKDPLFVTPVGICINYYNQKNNFIYVTVNGERVKLYDNSNLSVIDALMQTGYPNEKLFPRRGPAVNYTLNGTARMIRGLAGEPAVIHKNGKEANMNSPIEKNDYIDITESTQGAPRSMMLQELEEYKGCLSLEVNGLIISCPKYAYVNGVLQTGTYVIREGDDIVMENYYTVSQLFEFMDVSTDGKDIFVNNVKAGSDEKVYENFKVTYRETDYLAAEEEINEPVSDEAQEQENEPAEDKPARAQSIIVNINGRNVTLSGKKSYTFVDIFDFYPFDLTKAEGTELVTNVDGMKADFMGPVHDGSIIELYWKK